MPGKDGAPGLQGPPGNRGQTGLPGLQGSPGRSISEAEIRDMCTSVLRGDFTLIIDYFYSSINCTYKYQLKLIVIRLIPARILPIFIFRKRQGID